MASNQKMSRGKKVLELSKDAMFKISCKSDNIFKKHCDGRTDKVTYRGASLLKTLRNDGRTFIEKDSVGKKFEDNFLAGVLMSTCRLNSAWANGNAGFKLSTNHML